MDRNEILAAAGHCINGHRAQDYGRPENNFARIAGLWGIYTGREYTPEQVAIMLALLKIARLGSGRLHPDSYIDLAGYAALAGELAAAVEPVEPVETEAVKPVEDDGPNACKARGCAAWCTPGSCANYGRYPVPQAVEPLGAARSPQEPRNGPGGAGAFEPCTPLDSIKLQGEKPESEPEGPEAGALAELMEAVEKARGELARQGLQLVARYEIHRWGPVAGEGAD